MKDQSYQDRQYHEYLQDQRRSGKRPHKPFSAGSPKKVRKVREQADSTLFFPTRRRPVSRRRREKKISPKIISIRNIWQRWRRTGDFSNTGRGFYGYKFHWGGEEKGKSKAAISASFTRNRSLDLRNNETQRRRRCFRSQMRGDGHDLCTEARRCTFRTQGHHFFALPQKLSKTQTQRKRQKSSIKVPQKAKEE